MICNDDIIKNGNEILRRKADKIEMPLSKKDLNTGKAMLRYLKMSQDDKKAEKYKLRPGVGLAAPQINISKRFFAVYIQEEKEIIQFVVYNPEIIAESVQMIYLGGNGEGCLSIPNKSGKVLRHKKIKIRGTWYNPNDESIVEETRTFSEYPAIVLQHENDHLNGILFTDKITTNLGDAEEIC
ncbi:peptide deformylase [bacterium]|nr:peptide deformylase [bacterium]